MSLLEIDSLKVYYSTRKGWVKAVDGVSFNVEKGEIVGLAGESGCGKSTMAFTIMRLLPPEGRIISGKILFDGENLVEKSEEEMRKIRWRKISMIFQSAMNALNPVLSIERQMVDAIRAHLPMTREEAVEKAKRLFEMVGLNPDRIKEYPHEFSGGMRQRVMIAMALAADPQLVIADEPTTGLDVITQSKILRLMRDLQKKLNLSIMLITHDLAVIAETCDRVAIMYAGKIVEYSDVVTLFTCPRHPYAYMLISAFPSIKSKGRRLKEIKGSPPGLINPPPGCRFNPRCPYAIEKCRVEEPPYIKIGKGHFVACHLAEKLDFSIGGSSHGW
mgnify:CR=1 FL=1